MFKSEIETVEKRLKIRLPIFYINTMLNYPYSDDSFAAEFNLCKDVEGIIRNNSIFDQNEKCFAVGSDGGEYIYFIRIGEGEKVYIYDYERSDKHLSIESETWSNYLIKIEKLQKEILRDELIMTERRKNRKWWQFWI